MSSKSDKSLNDTLENRNLTEKSSSEESLFTENEEGEEEETLSSVLVQQLTPAAVASLRRCFRKTTGTQATSNIHKRIEEVMRTAAAEEGIEFTPSTSGKHDELWIDEEGFVKAIEGIFGANKFTPHARQLFHSMAGLSAGRLRWQQVARKLIVTTTPPPITNPKLRLVRMEHAKRETIVKIVCVETADNFSYAAVSRGGRVGVYSGALHLLYKYEVFYHRTGVSKRFKNRWITDAVYMSDVQCLAISSSDRSLSIYSAATVTHSPLHSISGIPDVPTCLSYWPRLPDGSSQLALGTCRGDVILLTFLRPRFRLLHANDQETASNYFWIELFSAPHTSYCAITRWRAHARSVARVRFAHRGLVLSCSLDGDVSLRAKHVTGKLEDYVVKVPRGISCFHYSSPIHSLAVGSRDGLVRVYSRGQGRPFAVMEAGSKAAILDVVLRPEKEMVVAFCVDCKLHLWNIYDESLLQTIKIKFPFLGVLGKKPEFGTYCIHPGPGRKCPSRSSSPAVSSRRSSVGRAPSGGLVLKECHQDGHEEKGQFEENFTRPDLLITCCDHVCVVTLEDCSSSGDLLPPPGALVGARKPSYWDLPDDVYRDPSPPRSTPPPPALPERLQLPSPHRAASSQSQTNTDFPTYDLDVLLENAGLQGILEKDFVLMFGLKHDLNRKLEEMKAKNDSTLRTVGGGAAYLTLMLSDPAPLTPPDDMAAKYHSVAKKFPPSIAATPAPSERSTPREKKLNK